MGRPENLEGPLAVIDAWASGMSNVKPGSLKWYGPDGLTDPEPADLVAAVRAGVESGTIEGEVVEWCEVHADWNMPWLEKPDQNVCRWAVKVNGEKDCRIVSKLLIPVSDGGSET